MGEQTDRKLYFSVNGVDYTEFVGLSNMPDVTTDVTPVGRELSLLDGCRNRKRFAKLLMSIGIPRNVAKRIRVEKGKNYTALWWYVAMANLCCCPS